MPTPRFQQHPVGTSDIRNVARVPARTDSLYAKRKVKAQVHPGCSINCRCHGTSVRVQLTILWAGRAIVTERFTTAAEAWDYAATYARSMVRQKRERGDVAMKLGENSLWAADVSRSTRSDITGEGHQITGGLRSPSGFTYKVEASK